VSKTFADPGASQAVAFAVTSGGAPADLSKFTRTAGGSGSFAWVTDGKDGKFTLTHDASVKFDGLAQGTYTVTEGVPSGFEAPAVKVSGGAGSKAVTNGAEIVTTVNAPTGSAAFTNKKAPVPVPEVPISKPTPDVPAVKPTPIVPVLKTRPYVPSSTSVTPVRHTQGPKTGDTSKVALWAVIMVTSALILCFVLWRRRKATTSDKQKSPR
jgi:hypothetical protein